MMKKPVIKVGISESKREADDSRRKFLKLGGLAVVGSSLMLYSCEPDEEDLLVADAKGKGKGKGVNNKRVFNLGKGDLAILNYAYILEQLEAAFYSKVVNPESQSLSFSEQVGDYEIFYDIYQHELIHRDFFETVLDSLFSPGRVAPNLEFDFGSVDFTSRNNVLAVSQILEDTGVQAYNGAGNLIENTDYLLIAGKIVSVEARHASAIRDLIEPGSDNFASGEYSGGVPLLTDLGGSGRAYDRATAPREILEAVAGTGFLNTKLITNNIPTA